MESPPKRSCQHGQLPSSPSASGSPTPIGYIIAVVRLQIS